MPKDKLVKLQSSDGIVFTVEKEVLFQCKTIRNLFECLKDTNDMIPLKQIDSETLAKIVEYCNLYKNSVFTPKKRHENQRIKLTDMDNNFMDVDDALLMKILNAANFLEIPHLIEIICQKAANMIKGKSIEEIRTIYHIPNDLTEDESEELKKKYAWVRP